jgi:hypothetical protein
LRAKPIQLECLGADPLSAIGLNVIDLAIIDAIDEVNKGEVAAQILGGGSG